MAYSKLSAITKTLEKTGYKAFNGCRDEAVERITADAKTIEEYLDAVTKKRLREKLGNGQGQPVTPEWRAAKDAIIRMNRLCWALGLPSYLPTAPADARRVLAKRRKKALETIDNKSKGERP